MEKQSTAVVKYTRWLISEILGVESLDCFWLCLCLQGIEFYWTDRDDANRAEDGLELRDNYIFVHGYDDNELIDLPATATVFEVLVAMADRATTLDYDPAIMWFNLFIKNLGFDYLNDDTWSQSAEQFVKSTVRKWLDRQFAPDGVGSPFRGNGTYDVAKQTMWHAMQWYLSDAFGEGHL